MANQIAGAYKKLCDSTKSDVLDLLRLTAPRYYELVESDVARAPEILTLKSAFKVVESSKTTRRFIRPSDAQKVKLTAKQILAVTVFDAKLLDSAVIAGVITADQRAAITLPSDVSPFPLVQALK